MSKDAKSKFTNWIRLVAEDWEFTERMRTDA